MSDVDPTPNTPVTVGDRLGWFRGDVATRLAAILGIEPKSLSDVVTGISELRGVNNATLSSLLTEVQFDTQSQLQNGILNNIKAELIELNDRVDKIQAVLGAEPFQSLETGNIRAFLLALVQAQQARGIPPDALGGAITAGDVATINGRRYVLWDAPIDGLQVSTDRRTLTALSSWSDYQIYVQSDGPTFQAGTAQGEWPTNSWLTAPLDGEVQVSVASTYTVRAFLRVPVVEPIILGYASLNEGGFQQGFAIWPEQFNPVTYLGQPTLAQFDAQGWLFYASGGNQGLTIKYRLVSDPDTTTRDAGLSLDGWTSFPSETRLVFIVRAAAVGPFTVALLPPGFTPPANWPE
jgi:hypothetical protein